MQWVICLGKLLPLLSSWTLPMQWDFLNLPRCLTRTLLNAMGFLFGKLCFAALSQDGQLVSGELVVYFSSHITSVVR